MEDCNQYVDVQDALRRIGGSMDLYKRLLGKFSAEDHILPLEKALKSGAVDDAVHAAHTLKGVASNLSLIKLATISSEFEQRLKEGLDCSDVFESLKQAYQKTSEYIAEID